MGSRSEGKMKGQKSGTFQRKVPLELVKKSF